MWSAEDARRELVAVLRDAQTLLALPGNVFVWSEWENAAAALANLDQQIATIENGRLPRQMDLSILFAPTGPIQEVSISSGWGNEFLAVSSRFDAAEKRVYG